MVPSPTGAGYWQASATGRRLAFAAWARLWASPVIYRATTKVAARLARLVPTRLWPALPLLSGWAAGRDVPIPAERTFQDRWRRRAQERW